MNATQEAAIRKHGEDLLAIFPDATERDPVKLCKKLRRLEAKAAAIGLRMCNGPEWATPETPYGLAQAILSQVNALLGNKTVPVFVNLDPRGYALKINDDWMRQQGHNGQKPLLKLHSDWGGYGIIAPEIK